MIRRIAIAVLAWAAVTNFFRGFVHAFAPDGGAHSIAGLDLTTNAQTILSLFAEMGFHQLAMGLFQVFVLAFRRDLVVIALGLQTAETLFGVGNLYLWRPFPVVVPGEMFNGIMLAVLLATTALALAGEMRRKS